MVKEYIPCKKQLSIIEMPTGSGKSLFGAHVGFCACKDHSYKRVIYIVNTKSLQQQTSRDALSWKHLPTENKERGVVCMYGRGNYYCPKRIHHIMSIPDGDEYSILRIFKHNQKAAKITMQYLKQLMTRVDQNRNLDDEFWFKSIKDTFYAELVSKLHGNWTESIDTVWGEICVTSESKSVCPCCPSPDKPCGCTCYKEMMQNAGGVNAHSLVINKLSCPFVRIKKLAKQALFLIINMDVLFSFIAHNGEDMLPNFITEHDFVIIDEAHMMSKRAGEMYKKHNFSEFSIEDLKLKNEKFNIVSGMGDVDLSIFKAVDKRQVSFAFKNKFSNEMNKMVANFELVDVNHHLDTICKLQSKMNILQTTLDEAFTVESAGEYFRNECENMNITLPWNDVEEELQKIIQTRNQEGVVDGWFDKMQCFANPCSHGKVASGLLINYQGSWYRTNKEIAVCKLHDELEHSLIPCDVDALNYAKTMLMQQVEHKLITEQLDFGTDFLKHCKTILDEKKKPTLDALKTLVTNCGELLQNLDIAKRATSTKEWTRDTKYYATNIPKIDSSGFSYDLTCETKATVIGKVLQLLPRGAMMMSATLTNPTVDCEDRAFDDFLYEIGISKNTNIKTFRMGDVFDDTNLALYVPNMMNYKYNYTFDEVRKYNEQLTKYIRMGAEKNPKTTLVVSNNLNQMEKLKVQMEKLLPEYSHIFFNRDVEQYNEYLTNHRDGNTIIYGSEGLCIGVDLPGRVGMVVIVKPFNEVRYDFDIYRQQIWPYQEEFANDMKDAYDRMYEFAHNRITLQAVGRIRRQVEDQGIVMLLSNNWKDKNMLKKRFKNIRILQSLSSWPFQ